jgi:type III restriction enzyme
LSYKIDKLIINSPYEKPKEYWDRVPKTKLLFKRYPGRRRAGYTKASESKDPDDEGEFIQIPLVNLIRERVDKWRDEGYLGVTGITRKLLNHWNNKYERDNPFFFCQLEAIETIIWLTEAPPSYREGINIPSDGGPFKRLCSKMATGTGKTTVMAMLIAWQVLNNVTYPDDPRFTKYVFILTPNLTIRNRLQVLYPDSLGNYYEDFNVVPYDLKEKLRQGRVKVTNWHVLAWDSEEKIEKRKSVDKRGVKSDEAYVREVLGEIAQGRNILIINDEAHHAWRRPAGSRIKLEKEEEEIATVWINGLDRINKSRGILICHDFTATPFAPTGSTSPENTLYDWIISDFNLNDAIESGLVKTPRIVFRDDSLPDKSLRSKLYHIYVQDGVKTDLNRKADPEEPLPQLVENAYWLLGKDWQATYDRWMEVKAPTPPVMITVANRTETAARIKYSFDHNLLNVEGLSNPELTLHIDSKILKADIEGIETTEVKQESDESTESETSEDKPKLSKKEQETVIRSKADTVGKRGKPGEQIRNVISVGMLSEGWDAKTVTHIMGLRAFSSQLLCEQVVGRGLRRTSYELNEEGLFEPEYVNIFGIPFSFLPHQQEEGGKSKPPEPKTAIEPVPEKSHLEIAIPNLVRVEHVWTPTLELDISKVPELPIDAMEIRTVADLAPVIDGRPDITKFTTIQLRELAETNQRLYEQMKDEWGGNQTYLIAQLIRIIEKFIEKGKIRIIPIDWNQDEMKRRIALTLSMSRITAHIYQQIRLTNTEKLVPQFNTDRAIIYTGEMRTWYTSKRHTDAVKSHINYAVYDSQWEITEAFELDRNSLVYSWVKNDHLGFEILYIHNGIHHKYRPDYIIRLTNGIFLILEVKGQPKPQDVSKQVALGEWIQAVNQDGRFGKWTWTVSTHPKDLGNIISKAATASLDTFISYPIG